MIVASESTTRERTSIAMAGAEALARNTLTWVPGSTPGRPSRPMQYRRGTVGPWGVASEGAVSRVRQADDPRSRDQGPGNSSSRSGGPRRGLVVAASVLRSPQPTRQTREHDVSLVRRHLASLWGWHPTRRRGGIGRRFLALRRHHPGCIAG